MTRLVAPDRAAAPGALPDGGQHAIRAALPDGPRLGELCRPVSCSLVC
jgi:hypothetical protein